MLLIMKRIILSLSLFAFCFVVNAQISTNSLHDGYWGNWKSHTTLYSYREPWYEYELSGQTGGIAIYKRGSHPSEFFFRFTITNYVSPDKKTKKAHMKNDVWYEYRGVVEYYVTEEYPDIVSILRKYDFPYFNVNSGSIGNPCVKRTADATIKIAAYKDQPRLFNIYFDNIGVAISFDHVYFIFDK